MALQLIVNGKPEPAEASVTIGELLAGRGIDPMHVVVEVNREIIARERFDEVKLRENDAVEILRFVGGG